MLIDIKLQGFRGGYFSEFYPTRDPGQGPGWFVFGRNPAYSGRYVMRCAQPNVKARKHPHYNCKVRSGWHTRREAQEIADVMNEIVPEYRHLYADLPLHGTTFKD